MTSKSNEEVVLEIMQYSRRGAVVQAVVMTALDKYTAMCIEAGPEPFESGFLSGEAWIDCCKEIREKLRVNGYIGKEG